MKLTEQELAARWKISLRSLQRMRKEGRSPPWQRLGYFVRYDIDEVIQFERSHERK
jgi:hypothetical protein